ncbi:hypothetical protein DFJ73DRAFT_793443 [Zopfochytrium polystomum]|nr:hypothetical protein DFJ73DRAFT_793443 [Zopfochytrium polystomum]
MFHRTRLARQQQQQLEPQQQQQQQSAAVQPSPWWGWLAKGGGGGGRSSSSPSSSSSSAVKSKREFHPVKEDSLYVLPSGGEEVSRLKLQHIIVRSAFGGALFHPHDRLHALFSATSSSPATAAVVAGPVVRVLDMGCGSGAWAADVAKTYPGVEVVGADIVDVVSEKSLPNFTFEIQDVVKGTSFPDNHFDFVYQRLLFLAIPHSKWPDVVKELKRITKPGGYVELVETGMLAIDMGPKLETLVTMVRELLFARGLDPEVSLHLTDHAIAGGLVDIEEGIVSLPVGWGGPLGQLAKINVTGVFNGSKGFVVKAGNVTDAEFDALVKGAMDESGTEDFRPFYQMAYASGRVDK